MSEQVHILYMEDNEGTAHLLKRRLSRAGYAIDIAPDGEAGLKLCTERSYDTIIVDYNMPGLSGLQVIRRLVDQGIMPPTIVLTGTGSEQIAVEALKLGAFDYVIKDIDGVYLDLLPTVIEQALKNQQLLEDKRKAEEALRESEKRFRSVIEQSLDGITLIDQDGKILEWNKAEEEITCIRREEVLGQYIWDVSYQMMPPEMQTEASFQAHKEAFDMMLQERESAWLDNLFEYDIVRPDGARRTIQAARFFIDLEDRYLVSEVARDITERKQMETALRESEERFRMLFEEAPDPYFVSDLEGNLIDSNRAVEPLLGLNRNDLIGKNFAEMGLLARDQLERVAEMLSKLPRDVFSGFPELIVTRPDGNEVVVDLRMIPIETKGETQILGIGHDITWRKQVEAQMKAYIEQLELLRQMDGELTRTLDVKYVQTMALDNMLRLTDATAGSISLIREGEVFSVYPVGYPEESIQHYSLNNHSIVARVARQREAEWVKDVTTDPDYCAVLDDTCSQITIPLVSQERLIGVVSLETDQPDCFNDEKFEFLKLIAARIAIAIDNAQLYDSTQRQLGQLKDLYEQISELEQLKTDMVRIVSHDLRNPLSAIVTYATMLEKTLGDLITEKQQRSFDQIDRSINLMKALITDVLSLENIEQRARGEVTEKEINFHELIQDVIEGSRAQAERKNQVIDFSSPDTSFVIRGNTTELRQATSNLIDNAIKYTPEGGKIDVVLKRQEGTVRFEVVDTGYGVPEAEQPNLFQPFERVRTEETRSTEGTGLGLYIVKKIVERNGGEIIFSSEYSKGSTFGFTLPESTDNLAG